MGTLGCLVWLVLFGASLHYGLRVSRIYYRYEAYVDAMRAEARLVSTQNDEAIRRSLAVTAEDLDLPAEARQLWIRRTGPPNVLEIEAWYDERLVFPFGKFVDISFHPKVEQHF